MALFAVRENKNLTNESNNFLHINQCIIVYRIILYISYKFKQLGNHVLFIYININYITIGVTIVQYSVSNIGLFIYKKTKPVVEVDSPESVCESDLLVGVGPVMFPRVGE